MGELVGALVFLGIPALIGLAGLALALRRHTWMGSIAGAALIGLGASLIWVDAIQYDNSFECGDGDCGQAFSVASAAVITFAAAVLGIAVVALIRWMFPRGGPA